MCREDISENQAQITATSGSTTKLDRNMQKKFTAFLVLTIIIFSLSLGVLAEPNNQSSTSESNRSTEKLPVTNTENINNSTEKLPVTNTENKTDLKIIYSDNILASPAPKEHETLNITNLEEPLFQVSTDYNYSCITGDPKTAIQNAIYSLPNNRTTPLNIYLKGTFDPVYDIILENNIVFVGNNATLILDSHESIFILNQTKTYSEVYSTFELKGLPYVDWFTLHNVTFQSIHFKQSFEVVGSRYAINFFYQNSTGWGISDNFSIYDCEFEGFIDSVIGLAFESSYINNYFHNYSNNGLLLVYGFNLTIQQNIFESSPSPISVKQYTSMYGSGSMIGCIGLFLLDVCDTVLVSDNMFIQGTNSTGLAFSSSIGNYLVTSNTFTGEGAPFLIDFNERPFLSDGIVFFDNVGVVDFKYNIGVYS
jgi:hypothetical protein